MRYLRSLVVSGIALGFAVVVPAFSHDPSCILRAQNASQISTETVAPATAIPHTLTYQATLTDKSGTPYTGLATIRIRLYDSERGGEAIWTDDIPTSVSNGVFSLQLGSHKPLPASEVWSKAVWLSTEINSSGESETRTALTASPFALAIADGAVTKSKLATDYVASVTVNGTSIADRGAALNFVSGDGIDMRYDWVANAIVVKSSSASGSKGSSALANDLEVKGDLLVRGATNLGDATTDRVYFTAKSGSDLDMNGFAVGAGQLQLTNSTNANKLTIAGAAPSANRTYTVPDAGADAAFVMTQGAQSISGVKTFASTIQGSVSGNAGTVTNGVYTTGSYSNPTWITSLATSKLSGSIAESSITGLTADLAALSTAISSETSARSAADASTLASAIAAAQSYSDTKCGAEASARATAVLASLTSANGYTDSKCTAESTARAASNATTLASAATYTDTKVAAEATLRLSGNTSTLAAATTYADDAIADEAAARLTADEETLTAATDYTALLVQQEEEVLFELVQTERNERIDADASVYADALYYTDNAISNEISDRNNAITASLTGKANDNAVVHKTGNETVAGLKTFSSALTTSNVLGGSTTPASGARYTDNNIIAWADVDVSGGVLTVNSRFGNCAVNRTGAGDYTVTLPATPSALSVNVTPKSAAIMSASASGSTITVSGFDGSLNPKDTGFYLTVVARP